MIQRIVCFKFKADAAPEAIDGLMAGFAALRDVIPQIVEYRAGRVVVQSQQIPDYDSMHYLTFANLADVDGYFHHEAHQQFVRDHREVWERVLVLNAAFEGA